MICVLVEVEIPQEYTVHVTTLDYLAMGRTYI